ncbi:AAA family ATPase [Kitasatospora sp. CM 4170]|uniref:ATP-binding protein n=1 Tax=Kitasatospora aburaviensis TaxID=67265 RepID=A0ABW1F5V7_9ACTN|nr:AAA family ATPase [Kitasatospora sp. CM 4170]WNM49148.1 AAA family ATPase [Kitasatospora sp. CM 4170]
MPDLSAVTSAPATTHSRPRAAGPVATRPRRRSDDPLLIGRERELDELDELLRQDAANGTFVLIQGEFGTGRTALLREALGWARSDGDTVLSAWADLSEQGVELGVARQLFEPALGAAGVTGAPLAGPAGLAAELLRPDGPAAPSTPADDPTAATPTGLYRLTAHLAARGRLVIGIDDLQWTDRASLLWLQRLLRRADELPVVVVATVGPAPATADPDVLGRLVPLFRHRVALTALDDESVAATTAALLGRPGDDRFREAVRTTTGGNPFLLHTLLRTIKAAGYGPDPETAARLTRFVPADAGRALHPLVTTAGPHTRDVAQAVAVLGGTPALDVVAAATGLPEPAVLDAVHALERTGLMRRTGHAAALACPMIGIALADDVLPSIRQEVHVRAAELLLAQGAPAEQTAVHAVHASLGLPWVPEVLERAAAEALRTGAADRAAELLRRALREPLEDELRATLVIRLGEAGLAFDVPEAVRNLWLGLDLSRDPVERAAAARRLAGALFAVDRYPDGLAVLERTAASLRGTDAALALRLEVDHVYAGLHEVESAPAVLPRLLDLRIEDAAGTSAERPLAALLGLRAIVRGESPAGAVALVRQALTHGMNPADDESFVYSGAVLLLGATGETELALDYADAAVEQARTRGSAFTLAHSRIIRASVYGQLGRVPDCQAEAEAALAALAEIGVDPRHSHSVLAAATLTEALVLQGRLDEAEAVLERAGLTGDLNGHWINDHVHLVRGRLRAARGRPAEALTDFRECGRRTGARGMRCPWIYPWRSEAALALAALGEPEQARTLAAEELELAGRWGVPEAVGAARRALALATGGPEGLELLREAVRTLAGTPGRSRHAQALGDLGARLRRAGRVAEARACLQQAVTAAHRCGAVLVADRALDELRAAGDRPRTRSFHGPAALTPTEHRVAGLAARGMTNREIAQHLFVGLRTVEVHLTHVYGKLRIDGRPGLAEALTPSEAP